MNTSNIATGAMRRLVVVTPALLALLVGPAGAATVRETAFHQLEKPVRSIVVAGHGYGAGVGMGQWGGFGYAVRYHFGYEQILSHFYGGTTGANLSTLLGSQNPTISVAILENANLSTNVGYDPVVTSPSPFTVASASAVPTPTLPTGSVPSSPTTSSPTTSSTTLPLTTSSSTTSTLASTTTLPGSSSSVATTTAAPPSAAAPAGVVVPGGSAVDLRLEADGTWSAFIGTSCALSMTAVATPIATGLINPIVSPPSASPSAPTSQLLTLCRHDGVDETMRGSIEGFDRIGYERTLNLVSLQSYLDGVVPAEEPASWGLDGTAPGSPQGEPWGFQALEAQAVASRSYTVAYAEGGGWNGYADICDTVSCEAYVGANYETAVTDSVVVATAGEVRVPSTAVAPHLSAVVATPFSASTGGWTAPGSSPAVRDRGDACVVVGDPDECNPNHTWRIVLPASQVTTHYRAIGRLLRLHVASRNDRGSLGGRAMQVVISGTKATLVVSGSAFATAVGLRSDWFAIAHLRRIVPG